MSSHRPRSSLAAIVVAVLMLLPAAPALAVIVDQLHSVEVPVTDQSPDARAKAFRLALGELVVRLTGDLQAPAAPELASMMRTPQRFIAEFAYRSPLVEPGVVPAAAPAMTLAVRFEGLAVERVLREAGRAVFGRERPRTLLWLVLDEGAARSFVGSEDADAFTAAAALRALPLVFPPLDATDLAALNVQDVIAQDAEKLTTASLRHGTEAWIGALVWRGPGVWQGRFTNGIGIDGSVERFDARAPSLDLLAQQAMDRLAAALAARYAVAGDELLAIDVAVEGVADVDTYASVLAMFQRVSIVQRVEVIGVRHDVLELRISFLGGAAALERLLALELRLARSVDAADAGALRYRYAP